MIAPVYLKLESIATGLTVQLLNATWCEATYEGSNPMATLRLDPNLRLNRREIILSLNY
jgi:hypothetical protein